jgi:HNH endonuclease
MASYAKKKARSKFRDEVLERARFGLAYRCQGPGCTARAGTGDVLKEFDAHHIIDRSLWPPGGGNVKENGICLCKPCHRKAEAFHETGVAHPGYAPADLFTIIGSSPEKARRASDRSRRVDPV